MFQNAGVQFFFRNFEVWLKLKQEYFHDNFVGLVVQTDTIFWSLWSISINEASIGHFSLGTFKKKSFSHILTFAYSTVVSSISNT